MPTDVNDKLPLTWTTHPLVENPSKGVLGTVLVATVVWVVHISFGELHFTILAIIFLLGSLRQFFFPTTYTLTANSVKIQGLIFPDERPWSKFRRVIKYNDQALLTPMARPTRLDAYRGVYIRFHGNRDEVLDIIEQKIAEAHPSPTKSETEAEAPAKSNS